MHQLPTNPPGKLCTRLFGEETTNYEQLGLELLAIEGQTFETAEVWLPGPSWILGRQEH